MWAPVLALVLVVAGVPLPEVLVNAMKLLGSATTGVALFATGIVLFAQRITVSRFVAGAVAARNVVVLTGNNHHLEGSNESPSVA